MALASTGTVSPLRSSLALGFGLCCYVLCCASLCAAQPTDGATRDASARALFQEGVDLAERSDWLGAEDRFRRAYTLRSSPVIAYNLASALVERGKLVEASEYLRRVQQDDKADASIKQSARTLQQELAGRIARITIRARDKLADDHVLLDASPLHDAQLGVEIPIDPGHHTLHLMRGDQAVDTHTLQIAPGSNEQVMLVAPSALSPSEVANASQRVPAPESNVTFAAADDRQRDRGSEPITSRWWFWSGVGFVAVGAIVLVAVLATSGSEKSEPAVKGDIAPGSIKVQVAP